MDFTKTNGCYSKNLINNTELINSLYEDKTVSKDEFAARVRQLVDEAYFNKTAKPRFLNALAKAKTKTDIIFLCYNSILCGAGCGLS